MTRGDLVEVAVRPAGRDDLEVLEALASQALEEVGKWRGAKLLQQQHRADDLARQLAECLDSDAHTVVLGTADGVVVAAGVVGVSQLASGDRLAKVGMLYVLPGARGVGVGKMLLENLLEWARQQGCSGFAADALPGDRLTKNFFESQQMVAHSLTLYRDL